MVKSLQDRLTHHLQTVARPRDPYFSGANHLFVREYIRDIFLQYGNPKAYRFQVRGKSHENVVLDLCPNPNIKDKPLILIGAHYDSVINCTGADDNASGIAVLLEMARFFSQNSANYPIRLIAFDLEEFGLEGSFSYANYLRQNDQDLRIMFSLEMLGYCSHEPGSQQYPSFFKYLYPNVGNFIALVGDIVTIPEMWQLGRSLKQNVPCEWLPAGWRGYPVPDAQRSDHFCFWEQGYKAIMVTDTANMRNPHYHQPTDTLETLDLDFLTQVCQGLCEAIAQLS